MATFDTKNITKIHQTLHSHLPSDSALRVKALESLLVEKGLANSETISAWVEAYSEEIGTKRRAKIVARA
jgi:nitrile hydratase